MAAACSHVLQTLLRVAYPCHRLAGDCTSVLDVGEDVREDLARMVFVGEPVDHRHARMRGEALDDRLLKRADHHDVHHPRNYARNVLDRLAARQLRIAAVQVDRDAAQLIHAGLERHARARRRLLEHHRERAIAQRLIDLVALEPILDPARALEQPRELVAREIAELQEVLGWRRRHVLSPPRRRNVRQIRILARDRALEFRRRGRSPAAAPSTRGAGR